ncbi:MAG: hypothetical protein SOR77_00670 [Peptoniphilus sp.]|uniref:hypothetical protein n=1 Tax=Peptoniphilus sp. TaxID=1971214 RepID=UPI002A75D12F|nr:hypothetical protein [Peptoniphilus sp.]MDY2986122.1 hypothetical protein [Peptoniphilus sp.]
MLSAEQKEKQKKLSEYAWLGKELDSKLAELEKWRSRLTSVTTKYSDMPSGNFKQDQMSEGISTIIDIENELNESITKLKEKRDWIYTCINDVEDLMQRCILKQRYLDGMKFEELAFRNNMSWRHMHRVHAEALNSIKI